MNKELTLIAREQARIASEKLAAAVDNLDASGVPAEQLRATLCEALAAARRALAQADILIKRIPASVVLAVMLLAGCLDNVNDVGGAISGGAIPGIGDVCKCTFDEQWGDGTDGAPIVHNVETYDICSASTAQTEAFSRSWQADCLERERTDSAPYGYKGGCYGGCTCDHANLCTF